MKVQPIADHPVLKAADGSRILCAGDLHVGIEEDLKAKGIHVPSQTFRMERELLSLKGDFDTLVLLGDIKHRIPGTTVQEYAEIPRFLRALGEAFPKVDVVRGNHDGGIEEYLPKGVRLHPSSGFRIGEVSFAHGHTWPSKDVMSSRVLVLSHNHPTVLFEDSLGDVCSEACWLRARPTERALEKFQKVPEEIIVMPALNRILGGSPVNIRGAKLLGPLFANGMIGLDEAKVYLLDGICLGRVRDIAVQRSK